MTTEYLKTIVYQFVDDGITKIERYGNGHINDTYKVSGLNRSYLLQRINSNLFKDVPGLMNNINLVTSYLRENVIKEGGNPDKEVITLIKTKENKNFYFDGFNYFRLYLFIENSISFDLAPNNNVFYDSAKAFGKFNRLLNGFDASLLIDVLPNFHNTISRYNDFIYSIENAKSERLKNAAKEIEFAKNLNKIQYLIMDELNNKTIPLRVTHNDTKLNNILFDKDTFEPLAVVDLDTIMKGSLLFDFGDSIRFGASTALEDEEDLTKVHFSRELYEIYKSGFLEETNNIITTREKELLPISAIVLTYECGIRFLTDFLNNDVYFKVHKENHNLIRCRTQFKLVEEMIKSFGFNF